MGEFSQAFGIAAGLLWSLDGDLVEIVGLSLRVSLVAVLIAALLAMPAGALLAVHRFPGHAFLVAVANTFMGLPPVVVGLAVYLALSRSGPFGVLELLYTPTAMIIAQVIIVGPLILALSRQAVEQVYARLGEQLRSFGMSRLGMLPTLLWEERYALTTVLLAGFGRAISEVGAVIIVGGNINHLTRVMTTAIALETSRGELALALALGLVLLSLALAVNLSAQVMTVRAQQHAV